MPDDIFARQIKDLRIDGLHRQRLCLNHEGGVTQRRIKRVILDVDQPAYLRQTRNIEPRFGDKCQRAFGAGQNARQVELAHLIIKDMTQIVAGQEAVQFREFIDDQLTLRFAALIDGTVDAANR